MDPNTQVQYFRKEHQDIRRFLQHFRAALILIHSTQDERIGKGLDELRKLEGDLHALLHHCYSEERNLESPYGIYLQTHQLETLQLEHERLHRLTRNLISELQFATTNQTTKIFGMGQQLAEFVKQHIAFEETLLIEIELGLAQQARQPSPQQQSLPVSKTAILV